ncbi:PhnD/SsuA/transferrin family substrate-binding protein [Pseudomonas gingeri]|uniref:phosphate/phosphite/phosphonate ABC transporter substrate-binding protein n=1 Tax=Pseudomonas gingeri TaxID=117681 RepID=UPI00159FF4B1|nr:PhnD/SsuA/transferrin family substrate-binding protein [Pseudomonas gingeri]NVZ26159.1 PhnD/SsuA/transferrin family substrate-binding protein [Pseudomonas gingeri]
MTARYAELLMYVAPPAVQQANEQWLGRILQTLGVSRLPAAELDLRQLWLSPQLLLTQTCGYPLMTLLRGQVTVIGRPRYELPDASAGNHCSLLLTREDNPRVTLEDFRDSRGVLNDEGSNSGMNLLRQCLAPLQRDGRFFASVDYSGAHRESLRWLREDLADLAAVDSVTFAYLARFAPEEVAGLRVVQRSAPSPCLPYIGPAGLDEEQLRRLREAMNQALRELPAVAEVLGLAEVLPASEADYQILLDYRDEAQRLGLARLGA